jgi:hypothetical protein
MPIWALAVYALATARLSGLVVADEITRAPREWLLARLDDGKPAQFVAAVVACQWCFSIYAGAVIAPVAWFWGWHPALLIPAIALGFSQITGMCSSLGRD